MSATVVQLKIWTNWLSAVCAGVIAFGLLIGLAPGLARKGFTMLVYAEAPNYLHQARRL